VKGIRVGDAGIHDRLQVRRVICTDLAKLKRGRLSHRKPSPKSNNSRQAQPHQGKELQRRTTSNLHARPPSIPRSMAAERVLQRMSGV
jgi:hypothetical protein